jgi:hypothetical protein
LACHPLCTLKEQRNCAPPTPTPIQYPHTHTHAMRGWASATSGLGLLCCVAAVRCTRWHVARAMHPRVLGTCSLLCLGASLTGRAEMPLPTPTRPSSLV